MLHKISTCKERISKTAADRLFTSLRSPECPYSTLSYEERQEALSRYKREHQGFAVPYYCELGTLLPSFGLTYRSFFALLGIPCHWPDVFTAALADKLAQAKDHRAWLAQLHRCTRALLPEIWSRGSWGDTPSVRMHLWRALVAEPEVRLQVRKEYKSRMPRFFRASDGRTRIDTEDLFVLGSAYGIPFHWLLCPPPGTVILAETPEIEEIIDDYLRLPESSRRIVEALADRLPVDCGKKEAM